MGQHAGRGYLSVPEITVFYLPCRTYQYGTAVSVIPDPDVKIKKEGKYVSFQVKGTKSI